MPPGNRPFDYEQHQRRLGRVEIPEKIKCKLCKKVRPQSNFSNKQLNDLRVRLGYNEGNVVAGSGMIACQRCFGQQPNEYTCINCDRTMEPKFFSKLQRRDPDNARCTNCIQGHLDTDPIIEENKLIAHHETNFESTTKSMTNLDLTDDGLEALHRLTEGESVDPNDPFVRQLARKKALKEAGSDDGVSLTVSNRGSSKTGKDIAFTAYDAAGKAYPRTVPGPPSAASGNAWNMWQVEPRSDAEPSTKDRRNPGFAKTSGGRFPMIQAPIYYEQPEGETIDSEDDDDDASAPDVSGWL